MTAIVWTYLAYLVISILLTIWVAHTLHKNGRVFLVDSFHGNEQLADSVNHLLVVGFYLINIGYVALALKEGAAPQDLREVLETISRKVGVVLLVLGGMHFFNLLVFSKMRRRALLQSSPPPIPPQAHIPVAMQ
jgi:TRAP-type C4-dicarboxylate transport system permease large subunit